MSKLNQLIKNITDGYENYRVDLATRPITDFIDDFSVWYLRRSRDRFKEDGGDKKNALATLRHVLYSLSLLIAPAMPFFAEEIYQLTKVSGAPESVHLCDWPKTDKNKIDKDLEEKMNEVRLIINLALAERIIKGIKVKQPLASLKVKNGKLKIKNQRGLLNLVKDELNVKEIIFDRNIQGEVELDINITEELKEEGFIRELIRFVQAKRKEENLIPQDVISVWLFLPVKEKIIAEKHKEFLLKEFRAKEIFTEIQNNSEDKINVKIKK